MGLRRSWYTAISAPLRSGFLAFVVMSRKFRWAWNPCKTLAACIELHQHRVRKNSWRRGKADLVGNKATQLLADFDIFIDRGGYELIELLDRLRNRLRGCLGSSSSLRRRGGRGRGIRGCRRRCSGLIERGDGLRELDGGGGDVFESSCSSFEPCFKISCLCAGGQT